MPTTNITLTITTPTGTTVAEAIDLFCQHHGYENEINGAANPESKANFAKRTIARQVAEAIKTQRVINAKRSAEDLENQNAPITVE